VYFTLSLLLVVIPLSQLISLFKQGNNLQIYYTFAIVILAACYLPPVVTNKWLPGYKIQRNISAITDKNDFE